MNELPIFTREADEVISKLKAENERLKRIEYLATQYILVDLYDDMADVNDVTDARQHLEHSLPIQAELDKFNLSMIDNNEKEKS